MSRRIYLDHSATTAMHPEVLNAMIPFMVQKFGNASSAHLFGDEAKQAMEEARQRLTNIFRFQS